MEIDVLYLGGNEESVIGRLTERDDGRVFFEYNADWVARGIELSPLHLPSKTRGSVTTSTPRFGPLMGLFADSLPDWWGEQMMCRFYSEKGIPWDKVTALQKLACTGGHAMGAIGYQPPLTGGTFRDELTVEVAELVSNAHSFLHGSTEKMLPGLLRSSLSPGGAQPKVLLGFNPDFSRAMAGGGHLPDGFERWLLKFDLDSEYQQGREEHAYANMARAAGINMAETRLLEAADGACHFLSKRFDRPGRSRRHVHTYSGITHTLVREGMEYANLMELTRKLTGREEEVAEVFRRACFNVFAGNDDDHAKNHAFLMEPDGAWHISPAYDLTSTSNPLVTGMRAASVCGASAVVGRRDLQKLADSQNIHGAEGIIEQVIEALRQWPRWASQAGLSEFRMEQVREEMPGFQM